MGKRNQANEFQWLHHGYLLDPKFSYLNQQQLFSYNWSADSFEAPKWNVMRWLPWAWLACHCLAVNLQLLYWKEHSKMPGLAKSYPRASVFKTFPGWTYPQIPIPFMCKLCTHFCLVCSYTNAFRYYLLTFTMQRWFYSDTWCVWGGLSVGTNPLSLIPKTGIT